MYEWILIHQEQRSSVIQRTQFASHVVSHMTILQHDIQHYMHNGLF